MNLKEYEFALDERPRDERGFRSHAGASWIHEITREKVITIDPAQSYPVCIAFAGEQPVEYPGYEYDDDEDRGAGHACPSGSDADRPARGAAVCPASGTVPLAPSLP